ncbi:glycosyltransferase [Microvirga sp. 0TCS3.31]
MAAARKIRRTGILGGSALIFVTVGSVFPFDRLIRAMDDWAYLHPEEHVTAQVGRSGYEPRHMEWFSNISPGDFRARVKDSSVIVAHTGMGTVITAAEFGRPIVLLPRRADLAEHTTDHQRHTANWLKDKPGIFVCMDENELDASIAKAYAAGASKQWNISKVAPSEMTERIREFIGGDPPKPRQ